MGKPAEGTPPPTPPTPNHPPPRPFGRFPPSPGPWAGKVRSQRRQRRGRREGRRRTVRSAAGLRSLMEEEGWVGMSTDEAGAGLYLIRRCPSQDRDRGQGFPQFHAEGSTIVVIRDFFAIFMIFRDFSCFSWLFVILRDPS